MNTEFIKDQLKLMLKKSSISHGDNNLVLVERLSADNNTNTVFITFKEKVTQKDKELFIKLCETLCSNRGYEVIITESTKKENNYDQYMDKPKINRYKSEFYYRK